MSQGAQTQVCTPGYSIYLNSGPLSGQILWGKWLKEASAGCLQQHWYECAYSMPKICVLCSTLNFSKVNSALLPPLWLRWKSLPTQPLQGSQTTSTSLLHKELATWGLVSFFLSPSFLFKGKKIFVVFNCMWRSKEPYVDAGRQAW